MMILNAKYGFAIGALLVSSSMYLYDTTGRTECYWFILGSLTFGCAIGTFLYCMSAYWGNKLLEKLVLKNNKAID
ncbi:MAG: hypothetical protein EBU90_01205 [Proteobacteria bacterium]|nr:hypothetical protein [Pseudomonadota bacterium]